MATHELGDMDVLRAKLQQWMRAHLPAGQHLVLEQLSFPESSGESSVSLLLDASMDGQAARFVCRMKPPNSEVFDEHDLPLQYRLMQLAADNDIPVPPLLGLERDDSLLGSDFYLMGFVDGQIPADNPPYAFGSWVTELSDEQRALMWHNGIATLARIHQLDPGADTIATLPCSAQGAAPAQHEIDKFNAMLGEHMAPVIHEAMRYINDHAPMDGPRRLCWGDARVGNVIWQQLTPAAILDWEMAGIGDPLQDVSWWYWIDYVNSVGLGLQRLGGLPSLAAIYAQWQALTGLPIAHAAYYDLFAVVRYAIILERKLSALEQAGLGKIDNFCVPILAQQLARCQAGT